MALLLESGSLSLHAWQYCYELKIDDSRSVQYGKDEFEAVEAVFFMLANGMEVIKHPYYQRVRNNEPDSVSFAVTF